MYCAPVICEVPTNATPKKESDFLFVSFVYKYDAGNFAGLYGDKKVFVSNEYDCHMLQNQVEPSLYPGLVTRLVPNKVWDGVPCGEGKV